MNELYIITITKNDFNGLRETLSSTSKFLNEISGHIIVNGGSCEESKHLISSYIKSSEKIIVISEPDNGIYDAMLKGAIAVRDDTAYVWYINSGDCVLSIPDLPGDKSCFFYGVVIKETMKKFSSQVWGHLTLHRFFPASIYWHQGFIIKRAALLKIGFGNYRYRGDLYQMSMAHRYLDYSVVNEYPCLYSLSGVSNNHNLYLLKEYFDVAIDLGFPRISILKSHSFFVLKQISKIFITKSKRILNNLRGRIKI